MTKTIDLMSAVKSYQLNTDLIQNYTITAETDPKSVTDIWEWKSQRQVDIANKSLYIAMNIHETPDLQPYIFQDYLVDGNLYFTQSSPSVGGMTNPWIKTVLADSEETTRTIYAQLNPQIDLLKSAVNSTDTGLETVNGVQCVVMQFEASAQAATDWVLTQGGFTGPSIGFSHSTTAERVKEIYLKAYQNGTVKLWIDPGTNLILKLTTDFKFNVLPGNMVRSDTPLQYAPGQENSTDIGFDAIQRNFKGTWEFSGYNQPQQIQLPELALSAGNG
jgi:hypothetical protein